MHGFLIAAFRWLIDILRALLKSLGVEAEPGRSEPSAEQVAGGRYRPAELDISSAETAQYRQSRSVLSPPERELYVSIRDATAGAYTILMKVRMADFVFLANEPPDRKFHNNQILCKHVDFLLCEPASLRPLLVIELDDASHKGSEYRIESDRFKDSTFREVGIPLMRVPLRRTYNVQELGAQIKSSIGPV